MALIDDLLAATSPAEILRHVARATWAKAHDGAECPSGATPTPAALAGFDCPPEELREAADRDNALGWLANDSKLSEPLAEAVLFGARAAVVHLLDAPSEPIAAMVWLVELLHIRWQRYHEGQWRRHVRITGGDWELEADPPTDTICHPLAPLVAAWQRRPPALDGATVTVTGNRTNMTRRAQLAATVRRVPWRLDAEVSGAVVDGEPMAAALPDPAGLFPVRTRRPRRRFQPGEQRTLNLPRVPALQPDLRLLALHDVSADPNSSPVLPGDVLELLTFAHLADRPLILTEREGAALLVRDRKGKPRHVQRQHDMPRFWQAAATLRSVLLFDPAGSGRWVDLATVEVPRVNPVDRVTIGPPAWARGQRIGKWTLTAEGSAAALARVTVGKQGLAGRVVTGLEYRIASGYSGKSGTVAPDLRPANARRKTGPGAPVFVTWRHVLRYAGDWWDETDPAQDKAALVRYRRAMATLERRGYFVGASPGAEAPAGDSVEIVNRVTAGGRGRPGGLMVRASARFVEAARLAQLPQGAGFERMMLTDYAGLGTLPTE